tara:strand:+ start:406 stop:1200 length:795 start_codon:yes stop_codon:yes gene_type:complete
MSFPNNNPTIDIIIGPMFAGKSTELIRRLNICAELGLKTLYVNSKLDERSDKVFSTHNPTIGKIGKIDSKKILDLLDIDFEQYDVIGIDEAQLFSGLKNHVTNYVDNYHKKIIVAGLNGDYLRKPFGEINDLLPFCDTITKLDSFCIPCSKNKKISKAIFTKRISQSTETLLIGGKESYIPTCRKCYNKMPDSESNILDRYKKDEDGNYWFNIIPDNVKESFKNDVMQSAVQYLSDMANSYQISIKNHEKFQEYVAAVSEWLKN